MNKKKILSISIQLAICIVWVLYNFRPNLNLTNYQQLNLENYVIFTMVLSLGAFGLLRFVSFMFLRVVRKPKFFDSWQEQNKAEKAFRKEMEDLERK